MCSRGEKQTKKLAEALYSSKTSLYRSAELRMLTDILQRLKVKPNDGRGATVQIRPVTPTEVKKVCIGCDEQKPASAFYSYDCNSQTRLVARCKTCLLVASRQKRQAARKRLAPSRPQLPPGLAVPYTVSQTELLQGYQVLRGTDYDGGGVVP